MELLNNESIQNYGIDGAAFNGECVVKNGVIEKLAIRVIDAGGTITSYLSDQTVRELHRELGSLISHIDNSAKKPEPKLREQPILVKDAYVKYENGGYNGER